VSISGKGDACFPFEYLDLVMIIINTKNMKSLRYLLLTMLILPVLILSSCTDRETAKKVSLYSRQGEDVSSDRLPHINVIWFGFDQLLGPREEVMVYTPFIKYLEKKTGRRYRIMFPSSPEETLEDLGNGRIHFALLNTLNYVIGRERYGIKFLVSGVDEEGSPYVRSAIFVRSNSDIQSIKQLKGRCLAFGPRNSASGYLIPLEMLEANDIELSHLDRYLFSPSDIDTIRSVINGECDAGGVRLEILKRIIPEDKVRIIATSEPYPGLVVSSSPSLDTGTLRDIRDALLGFDPSKGDPARFSEWVRAGMPHSFTDHIRSEDIEKIRSLAVKYGVIQAE